MHDKQSHARKYFAMTAQPKFLSMTRARAQREADARARIARERERLIAALDRVCSQSTLGEDNVQAALLTVAARRARSEAEANARRRWPHITGRNWGEF